MKKHHSSPRTLRRSAERKAHKEAFRARKAETAQPQPPPPQQAETNVLAAGATASVNRKENEEQINIEPAITTNTENESEKEISDGRLKANRANAQRSTVRVPTAGRIASSQNRRVHGLTPGL